jgi:hypothetical protein
LLARFRDGPLLIRFGKSTHKHDTVRVLDCSCRSVDQGLIQSCFFRALLVVMKISPWYDLLLTAASLRFSQALISSGVLLAIVISEVHKAS